MEQPYNYSPRALNVLSLARKEAMRLHHNYLGTEHLLLGLVSLGHGVAVTVIQKMGLSLDHVRAEVEKQTPTGAKPSAQNDIPYTPRLKNVLALANQESKQLGHAYVSTEHLLLGLLLEGEGVGARVLISFDFDLERLRSAIIAELPAQPAGA